MAFKGITFAGQNVTPKNDGGLYMAHHGDGILWGCSMAVSGDDLVIQSGEFILGGRVVQVDGATNVDLSGRVNTNGYIQVIMNADMTQSEGSQWYTTFVESATTTFPALTTDPINNTGDLYQLQLAIVQVSGGNLTSVYATMGYSSVFCTNPSDDIVAMRMLDDGTFRIAEMSGGNSVTGIGSNGTGNLLAFADGQSIVLRPNGITSTTGQIQYTTGGQQIGGHPIVEDTKSTSTSVTAGTWTSALCTVTLDVGQYLLTGTANIRGTGASTTNWAMINIGHNTSSNICRNSICLCGTTSVYLGANASILFDNSTANYTMDLYVNAEAATTVSNATLRAVRLG